MGTQIVVMNRWSEKYFPHYIFVNDILYSGIETCLIYKIFKIFINKINKNTYRKVKKYTDFYALRFFLLP